MKNINILLNNLQKYNITCDIDIKNITSVHQRANFICNVCKYKFNTFLRKFVDKTSGCSRCSGKIRFTQEQVDLKVQNNNCVRIELYKQARLPFKIKCNSCGHEWKISLDNLCRGKNCPQCAIRSRADLCRYSADTVIIKLLECNFELVNKFTSLSEMQDVKCLKCNFISSKIPHNIINELAFCQACTGGIRLNERLIKDLLRNKCNLKFIFNYSVKLLGSNKNYKIDFYFPDEKIAIEYNGLQHYQAVTFGSKKRDPQKMLKIQQERDNYVRGLCKNSNIKIIEIDGRKFRGKKLKILILDIINAINLGDVNAYCET